MKILVTGGAGYIGSHTALEALRNNHDVIVFDSLERGYKQAIERVEKLAGKRLTFIKGDLRNIEDIGSALVETKPDVIIHFAAYKSVGEGQKEPEKYYENNVKATQNLLEAMNANNVKKIIFSSSSSVYGMAKDLPITEETPTGPISVYGKTKLEMEKLVDEYTKKYLLQSVSFRYFNAIGADSSGEIGEDPSASTCLSPLVMQTIVGRREKILLFGNKFQTSDGTQERDYIHVSDLASAHILAAEKDIEKGKMIILNLSTGTKTSCLEIFDFAEAITGKKLNYEVVEPREGDPITVFAVSEKAREYLGWAPKRDIRESLKDQWNWTRKNPDGYGNELEIKN